MDEVYSRIITEIDLHNQNPNNTQTPLPHSTLSDIQSLFDNALDSFDTEDIDRLWEEFALRNLSPSSIITPLTATMDFAHTHLSLFAAQLYLSLLLSPNSPVFTLFTPIAFVSFLASLRRSFKQNKPPQLPESGPPGPQKKKRGGPRGGQGGVRGGRGKRGKSLFPEDEEMTGEETAAAEGANSAPFDVRDLFPVLQKLENVLSLIHLDRFPDSLKSLINTITALPITALEHCENLGSYNQLSDRCFRILKGVLKPEHGDVTNTSVEVLKSLSPSILLLKSQAKTSAMKFVTHQMMRMGKENEAVRKALVYLPRYLSNKAPERSDPRAAAVESILEIVRAMESEDQIGFVDYVVKMTQGKGNLRLLAVDIIPALLLSLPDPLGVDVEDAVVGKDWWGLRCLEALISRCADAGAVTRARAISNLAQVVDVLSGDLRNRERLKEIMGFASTESEHLEGRLNELLRKRCTDEKAMVRKASLLLITKSTALLDKSIDGVLLKTMGIACSDPLLSIRKAAISALSEVFRRFSDENVIIEWLHSVPQLITDNESSIQEECENLFLELVLNRLSRVGSMDSVRRTTLCSGSASKIKNLEREMESAFPEGVLILLKGICDADVTPCLKKICTSLGKKKRLKPSIAFALQNIIRTSESIWLAHSMPIGKWTAPPGAWLLLSEVSIFLPKAVGWEFLHHHWQLLDKSEVDNEIQSPFTQNNMDIDVEDVEANSAGWAGDRVFLLQTISNVSVELPPEPAAELASKLLTRIEEFNMHTTEVNAHVKALRTLCKRQALKPEEGDQLVLKWVTQLVSKGLGILQTYISEALQVRKANDFRTPPRSVVRKGKKTAASSKMLLQAVTAVYTVGSLVIVCPSLELNDVVEVLQTIITSGKTGMQLKKLPNTTVSIEQLAPSLYIHSWVTMGKICLANDKLAKRYIPLFVKELETNESAALRNNIVLMMADFCVRYTALVDCYISKITNCLRDPCEVVRRQTFILLSRLLQRDYVKWRGVLFLRFLLCLVDESEKIRQLADFLFGNILRAKAPLLAYNSFVEAIFVLNDCHAHAGHSDSQGSRAESRLFSIRGNDEKSRTQRMHIYVSLLKQMAPEHLLATSAKLCAEILAAASDGLLNLDDVTGQTVLQDALQILACKEIRIQSNRGAATDSTEMDEEAGDSGGADAAAAAKRRVVAQVAKKSLIQNALPIFIELKRLLESNNSPLTGCLMECLRNLLKDYKNEFDDILVADKQLQKELMYDMEKYEALKTKSTVAEAVATVQRANVYASPPGRASVVSKIVTDTVVQGRLAQQLASPEQVASVMADVAAEKTVKSVLKDVNRNGAASPLLGSMSRAKLKPSLGGPSCRENLCPGVLESLTKRHNFDSMDIN